jgi:hypothetical protein
MKILIIIASCYLLCRITKSIWKSFLIGFICYLVIAYNILIATAPKDAQLNITWKSFSYFATDTLAEFVVYFTIGLIIYLIFKKSKKTDTNIQETTPTENND